MKPHFLLQWNLNGFYNNYAKLNKSFPDINLNSSASKKPDYCHTTYQKLNLISYIATNTNALIAADGVAIFVYESIIVKKHYQINSQFQNVTLRITTRQPLHHLEFTLCNIYIPPHQEPSYEDISDLVAHLPQPLLLLGDFNLHSSTWGSH